MTMRNWLFILVLFSSSVVFAQADFEKWKKLRDDHSFQRAGDYEGVKSFENKQDSRTSDPNENSDANDDGVDYAPEQNDNALKEEGDNSGNNDSGSAGGGGSGENSSGKNDGYNPKELKGKPKDIKFNPPNFNPPKWNFDFSLGKNAVTWILVILSIVLVAIIVVYFLNRKKDIKISIPSEVVEVNPESITKSELEIQLEKAESNKNYRECVRILFIFILKELISKNWIHWKIDKTNADYKREILGKTETSTFSQIVYIFDAVWYGEKFISTTNYQELKPEMLNYYQKLVSEK